MSNLGVIDAELSLGHPLGKRLTDLDAIFRDAARGKKSDVNIKYSSGVGLSATADVRQGSCTLYTSAGSVRFEPAGVIVAQIGSSGPEKRFTGTKDTGYFWIEFSSDTHGDASATLRVPVGNEESRGDVRYCQQPLAVRNRVFSRVVGLTFMLSEDFRGEVHDWRVAPFK